MKRLLLALAAIAIGLASLSQNVPGTYSIQPSPLVTRWAKDVSPSNALPEYPRPQMVRNNWINLNGLWDYSIVPKLLQDTLPVTYDGRILVPFAVESALSGVGKSVGKDSILWYRKKITIPSKYSKKTILLHFGAVDWL